MLSFLDELKLCQIKYPSLTATNDKTMENGTIEQANDYNASLEDLKTSNEAKKGSFLNKLAFWQTSNEAKLSAATEKKHVGVFTFISALTKYKVLIYIEILTT